MTIGSPGQYHNTKVYSLIPNNNKESLFYWLGILNSPILWFFIKQTGYVLRGGYYTFTTDYLKPFPIHTIDFNNPKDKELHNKLDSLVSQMLKTQELFQKSKTENDKKIYQQKTELIDHQIDHIVYDLYKLTEEDIKIIESN